MDGWIGRQIEASPARRSCDWARRRPLTCPPARYVPPPAAPYKEGGKESGKRRENGRERVRKRAREKVGMRTMEGGGERNEEKRREDEVSPKRREMPDLQLEEHISNKRRRRWYPPASEKKSLLGHTHTHEPFRIPSESLPNPPTPPPPQARCPHTPTSPCRWACLIISL